MAKRTKRKTKTPVQLPESGPGPDPAGEPETGLETGLETEGDMFAGLPPIVPTEEVRRVGPTIEESARTRFESPVPEDTLVVPQETYENLGAFFANIPNRERFEIQVWRCEPNNPTNQRKRDWKGRIPLPTTCTLEEAVDREFGGGVYYWRLGCENRHASRTDLPADFQAMPMTGYVRLGTPEKEESPAADSLIEARLLRAESSQSELLNFLKEQVRENRNANKGDGDALTKMMTVMLTANQQSMQLMQTQAQQQQAFLMAMLASTERKASEAREGREEMMHLLMESVRGEVSGEKSMGQTIVENLPRILEGLSRVPALSSPSPRVATPQAAPVAPAVQVVAPVAPATPAVVASQSADDYPTLIAKRCIAGWQGQEPVESCASAIEELGTDDNFNDLLDTPDGQVIFFLSAGFKAANKMEAPPELLEYAAAVLRELHDRYPEESGFTPPAVASPAVISVTPPPADTPTAPSAPVAQG